MNKVVLITGGARSGKSSFAVKLAMKYNKRGFIATAIPFDEEMKIRIAKHKEERENKFTAIEEPYNLDKAIINLENNVDVIIIDCISVWLGNLLFKKGQSKKGFTEINKFYNKIKKANCDILIVTNEVGAGIIPNNKLARNFRDIAGFVNQKIAKLSDEVFLLVSGIPIKIKGY